MTKILRYKLTVDEDFVDKLTRVADASSMTKPEAIMAGINLLERLVEADKQGKEFAIVEKFRKENK